MLRSLKVMAAAAFVALGVGGAKAEAQGIWVGAYGGGYPVGPPMVSRGFYSPARYGPHHHRHYRGCGHHGYGHSPSVVRQRGFIEGEIYETTGRLPNHRLSPAERQGFLQGERAVIYGRPW